MLRCGTHPPWICHPSNGLPKFVRFDSKWAPLRSQCHDCQQLIGSNCRIWAAMRTNCHCSVVAHLSLSYDNRSSQNRHVRCRGDISMAEFWYQNRIPQFEAGPFQSHQFCLCTFYIRRQIECQKRWKKGIVKDEWLSKKLLMIIFVLYFISKFF